jgi:RHS repeat-associated protein
LTYPGGKTVAYTYDANNRLATVKDWAARLTQYTYDFNGRLALTSFPNAAIETRTYDLSGKLTTITDRDAKGNVLFSSLATMDAAGRILSEALSPAPTTAFSMPGATMTYDSDNRLKSYNSQLVSFDLDGNMLAGPLPTAVDGSHFTFDPRNHLSQAAGSSYQYGPEGRRTSWTGSDGITRTFVIDPSGALDRTLIRTKGTTTTYYVYGLGLLYQEQATVYQQHHFDSRGSTVAITSNTGLVTDRFQYGPYGEPLGHTGSTDTPFQFNGRYGVQTDLNGLLYMRARYYDPTIRRFINQDPTLGSIALGITLDRFAFANGNPVSLMDPFGWCAQDDQYDGLGSPTTLQGWQQSGDDLITAWNTYLAWTQQNRAWLQQEAPWLDNYMDTVEKGARLPGFCGIVGDAEIIAAEGSVWDLNPLARGRAIEQSVGANLPSNFPIIDGFANGVATSIKSLDLGAATYQDTTTLSRTINGYVDSVAAFNGRTWAGVTVDASQITARQLQLAVPTAGSAAQQAVISAAVSRAQGLGVQLIVTPFP